MLMGKMAGGLLLSVSFLLFSRNLWALSTCSLSDSDKKDCGYFGIDQVDLLYKISLDFNDDFL